MAERGWKNKERERAHRNGTAVAVDLHIALLGVVVVLVTSRLLEAKPGM